MLIPDYLHPHVDQLLTIEQNAAIFHERAESRRSCWAVVLGLRPILDGDQWCVLWGNDLQEGVAAFGRSPEEAIEAFEGAMRAKL